MKVKEECENVGLKLNIQKTKITAYGCITSWQMYGETMETVTDFLFFSFFFLILFYFKTLKNCISYAKYQNKSATGIHVFPILNPPPFSLPIPSLWVVPVHQPQASSIVHRTWTGISFHT